MEDKGSLLQQRVDASNWLICLGALRVQGCSEQDVSKDICPPLPRINQHRQYCSFWATVESRNECQGAEVWATQQAASTDVEMDLGREANSFFRTFVEIEQNLKEGDDIMLADKAITRKLFEGRASLEGAVGGDLTWRYRGMQSHGVLDRISLRLPSQLYPCAIHTVD